MKYLIDKVNHLGTQYNKLKVGKASLLALILEAELAESVFNSNAIENSTLTIKETEKILLELEFSRNVSIREVFEAKNLARVFKYVSKNINKRVLDSKLLLLLHKMLISNIDDSIAGRFRKNGEYVRVGVHIAPGPEVVNELIHNLLFTYSTSTQNFLERIARFHLEFETIHPFCDGNGRIGRLLINFQLMQLGLPPIIIRDKNKSAYYDAFKQYQQSSKERTRDMQYIVALGLMESLHKRIAYLSNMKVVRVTKYAKERKQPANSLLNKAKRQTIRAFREQGVWKIGV